MYHGGAVEAASEISFNFRYLNFSGVILGKMGVLCKIRELLAHKGRGHFCVECSHFLPVSGLRREHGAGDGMCICDHAALSRRGRWPRRRDMQRACRRFAYDEPLR